MSKMPQASESIASAFKKAAGQIRQVNNKPTDGDVAYYESLKPEDFDAIQGQFGMEETRRYVMDMEARRRKIRRMS